MKSILLLLTFILLTIIGYSQGQTKFDSLLTVLKSAKEDTLKVNLLNAICDEKINSGEYNEAKKYADEAFTLAHSINFKKGMAKSYRQIGITYYNLSNFPLSLEYYLMADTIDVQIGNNIGHAKNFNNIGNVYDRLSDYPKALEYWQKALTINEHLGNKSGIALNTGNIGNLYN